VEIPINPQYTKETIRHELFAEQRFCIEYDPHCGLTGAKMRIDVGNYSLTMSTYAALNEEGNLLAIINL
jgi:hypothetical protein